jgi:hypothetical protein
MGARLVDEISTGSVDATHRTRHKAHYNRFRTYDPAIGRYISADPIGQLGFVGLIGSPDLAFLPPEVLSAQRTQGHVNLYLYARSNPLVFIDVLGLDPDEAEAFWSSSAKQRAAQAFCGLAAAGTCFATGPGPFCAAAVVAGGGAALAIEILGAPDTAEQIGEPVGEALERRLDRLGDIDENTTDAQRF